jgi:hypothetical protein
VALGERFLTLGDVAVSLHVQVCVNVLTR